VDVTTPSVPGKTWSVPVTFIDPNISDPTRSAKVRVEIPNPLIESAGTKRRELFHRLYAEGIVNLEIPEVLAVPRLAVLSTGERTVAYIDKGGGAYEQRRLKLGRHGDEFWEVLSGLSEGDRVVTTGNLLIDGQAQLDQSASGNPGLSQNPSPPTATNSPASSALSETQRVAVKSFIELADSLTRALSSDDLKAFNDRAAQVHAALPSLVTQFDHQPDWQPLVQKLEMSGHLEKAADLKSARKSFHPFSAALVEFSQQLRRQPGEFATLKIYRCPMVKQAFPGAPNGGVWLQLSAPIHNPYFGAEMLDCGNEVAQ
jgi:Cu(I)/Ag(I) efflux system membrane fusion protein